MKNFLKTVIASFIGGSIAGIVVFLIALFSIIVIITKVKVLVKEEFKTNKVKDNSILQIKFDEKIVENKERESFYDFYSNFIEGQKIESLYNVLKKIERAKNDDKIKGIFLDIDNISISMAGREVIREKLLDFKKSKKWIISYSETYSQSSYYLASVGDEVYLNPMGSFGLIGFRYNLMFLKGLLDKLDIDMQIIRGSNNKFKSAVEPYLYDHMSEANREQLSKMIKSMWNHYITVISESRAIDKYDINYSADKLEALSSSQALKANFIDGLKYRDEVIDILMKKVNVKKENKLNLVNFLKYRVKKPNKFQKEKIALIYAGGTIFSGKSKEENMEENMGSTTICEAIKTARTDTNIKAIVLRVNSPGGSALASDVITREVALAKEVKPVIVSMGDLAASGGYYISCLADKIFANKNTITGSIGVFGVVPNIGRFMKNKIGITFDDVKTNENTEIIDFTGPLTDFQKMKIQKEIDVIYNQFLTIVSKGRNMTKEEIDAIGQGRIWVGTDALKVGLVDTLGGLEDALLYAQNLVNMKNLSFKIFPKRKNEFKEIIEQLFNLKGSLIEDELGDTYKYYERLKRVKDIKGIQARLPFFIDIY